MIAVDTNVLVYAHREEMPLHDVALSQLRALAEGDAPWGLPIFAAGEFVRVVTHRRIFDPPTDVADAIGFLDDLMASPTVRLLTPGARWLEVFGRLVNEARATGNLVFDAQIAAVCVESGASELLTEDRDFARFREIRTRTLR